MVDSAVAAAAPIVLSPAELRAGRRQAIAAAVIGNILEWYDFSVYAFVATIIAKRFFPAGDEIAALLSTFAAFGLGFLARPLGGIVIGRLADRRGRKAALILTILIMAAGTVAIGLIPGYETLGWAAPALLVLARLAQGFSTGGEWGGSTSFIVEWAPDGRRGLYGSFHQASVSMGLLFGSGVTALLSTALTPEQMTAWGWRLPFLIGGLLLPVGLYLRRNIAETPAFRSAQADRTAEPDTSGPLLAARAFGFTMLWTVTSYVMLSFMPTFTQKFAGLSRVEALWSSTAGIVMLVVAIPVMGLLSDRLGRRPLLLTCTIGFIVLSYPIFALIVSGSRLGVILPVQIGISVLIAFFSGPGPAAIAEIFPTRARALWMSIGYSFAVAIFGGFAPYIATWLIDHTGSPLSPSFYVIACAIVSSVVIWRLKETAHDSLR
ncbi:MAG: MFS transporter [Alphaproteobacteria bacterium]|nr:MFS transporter [Alphaproteobacteria bacterium]MBV9551358.1 MFS transporter [Alphaproteobacteria bacterium]